MSRAYALLVVAAAVSIACIPLFAVPALAVEFPGASGMALIDETHFLVVQDTKYNQPGDRLGVLSVDPRGGYDYTPLDVDWPVRPAHDLESCYGFRTRPGEFLAAESGSYLKDWQDPDSELYQGRIWHLKVTGGDGGWQVEVLKTYDIPWKLHEIEGMISIQMRVEAWNPSYVPAPPSRLWMESDENDEDDGEADDDDSGEDDDNADEAGDVDADDNDEWPVSTPYAPPVQPEPQFEYRPVIVLATRGGDYPYEVGRVYWGYVDFETGEFALSGEGASGRAISDLVGSSPFLRGCSDMYIDRRGCLWLASCEDLGDNGPFRSRVVRYGSLDLTSSFWDGPSSFPSISWTINGLKVEALGAPVVAGCVLSFATDDEDYGGIWRPLGPPAP